MDPKEGEEEWSEGRGLLLNGPGFQGKHDSTSA